MPPESEIICAKNAVDNSFSIRAIASDYWRLMFDDIDGVRDMLWPFLLLSLLRYPSPYLSVFWLPIVRGSKILAARSTAAIS